MTPTGHTGWKPRYSPDGSRVTWEQPGYWQAQWFTETQEIAQNGAVLVLGAFPGIITDWLGANELSAGGSVWAAFRTDPPRVYTNDGTVIQGAGVPVVNPDGLWGFVDDYLASFKKLIFNGGTVWSGAITEARASRQALVWSDAGRTWGVRLGSPDMPREIQAAPTEFRPVPIDTPTGPWVGCHTDTGIVLRPYGLTDGYRFDNGGQCFYPDWTYRAGAIVAIFTNDAGVQFTETFPLDAPRVPLGTRPPEPPDPGPEPPEPPDPGPEPPEPGPEPPEPPDPGPTPIPPTGGPMEPFAAAFQIGVHVARVDRHGIAPWPGWFPIRFDRTDTADPEPHFTVSQPEPGNPRLMVTANGGGFLTADFTEFGGSVCDGFYCSPEALGWGGYQQWNGWTLGTNGPEILLVQYQDQARAGQCSPSLTVVRL